MALSKGTATTEVGRAPVNDLSLTYELRGSGDPVVLTASIEEEGGEWDGMQVRVDAHDSEGELLVEGRFKVIPLAPDRFKKLLGLQALPAGWTDWLEGRAELTVRA